MRPVYWPTACFRIRGAAWFAAGLAGDKTRQPRKKTWPKPQSDYAIRCRPKLTVRKKLPKLRLLGRMTGSSLNSLTIRTTIKYRNHRSRNRPQRVLLVALPPSDFLTWCPGGTCSILDRTSGECLVCRRSKNLLPVAFHSVSPRPPHPRPVPERCGLR